MYVQILMESQVYHLLGITPCASNSPFLNLLFRDSNYDPVIESPL